MQTLVHTPGADDSRLPREATDFFVCNRIANFVHDIYTFILDEELPGLTYVDMHARFPPRVRMEWLAQRPDLRRDVVTHLAMHAENAAYALSPSVQAERIAEVIASEDVGLEEFERAFEPEDLAVYAAWAWFWFFYDCADWTTTNKGFRDVVKRLLERIIEEPGGEYDRDMEEQDGLKSILTPEQFYGTIDPKVWDEHIPLWLRTKIADAMSSGGESPRSLEAAKLEFVPPKKLVQYIPLINLKPIFFAAMRNMEQAARMHAAMKEVPAAQVEAARTSDASATTSVATRSEARDSEANTGAWSRGAKAPVASREAATPSGPSAVTMTQIQKRIAISELLASKSVCTTEVPAETPSDIVDHLYTIVILRDQPTWADDTQERYTLSVLLYLVEPMRYSKDLKESTGPVLPVLRGLLADAMQGAALTELKDFFASLDPSEAPLTVEQMRTAVCKYITERHVGSALVPLVTPDDVVRQLHTIVLRRCRPEWKDEEQERYTLSILLYTLEPALYPHKPAEFTADMPKLREALERTLAIHDFTELAEVAEAINDDEEDDETL